MMRTSLFAMVGRLHESGKSERTARKHEGPVSEQAENKRGLWGRLKTGLGRTREQLATGMGNLLLGEKEIDEGALDELETALLQ